MNPRQFEIAVYGFALGVGFMILVDLTIRAVSR